MSSLEDAIREHLELKQGRGADAVPSEWIDGNGHTADPAPMLTADPDPVLEREPPPREAADDRGPVDWSGLERALDRGSSVGEDTEWQGVSSIPDAERRARREAARARTRRARAQRRALLGALPLVIIGVVLVAVAATSSAPGRGGTTASSRDRSRPGSGRGSKAKRRTRLPAGAEVLPFDPPPELRAPDRSDGLPPFWSDGVPCAVGCRAAGVVPGWPLRPFHRQHALRSGLNEERETSFHHGIDIQARDGDPVYAIQPGRAHIIEATGPDSRVRVGSFIYWHVKPTVAEGARVAPYQQVVGTITSPHRHLHLSEVDRPQHYLNPLRPGGRALEPWVDTEPPVLGEPEIDGDGRVAVHSFDPQSFRVRTDYETPVIAPAALGYRIFDSGGQRLGPLHWALRGSHNLDWTPTTVEAVFASPLRRRGDCFTQKAICKQDYFYVLAGGLAPRLTDLFLTPGRYRLAAYAWDWAGSTAAVDRWFTVEQTGAGEQLIRPDPAAGAPQPAVRETGLPSE